jgi:hypothetical protein
LMHQVTINENIKSSLEFLFRQWVDWKSYQWRLETLNIKWFSMW